MPRMLYRKQGPDEYRAGLEDGWDMSPEQHALEDSPGEPPQTSRREVRSQNRLGRPRGHHSISE